MHKTALLIGSLFAVTASVAGLNVIFNTWFTPVVEASETTFVSTSDSKERPEVNFGAVTSGVGAADAMFGGSAVAGATADFDSDGVKDVVTVDTTGRMRLFRGNADTIYPNHPEAVARRAERGEPTPFEPTNIEVLLPIVPDQVFSGDLNGDGFSDIIAAKNGMDSLILIFGGGYGAFSQPVSFPVGGRITAVATGEIGRKDQVIDLAVAYQNKEGSFVAIYEHPEGTFRVKPDVFRVPSPVNSIAIGKLDTDAYNDVALASGNQLTLVHGRGNPYPIDWVRESNIERPRAVTQTRQMPFQIADMVAGHFGERYGESLMMLGIDGRLVHLEADRSAAITIERRLKPEEFAKTEAPKFLPVDGDIAQVRVGKTDTQITKEQADDLGLMYADADELKADREKVFREHSEAYERRLDSMTPAERSRKLAEETARAAAASDRRKQLFESMLSAKSLPLARYQAETIVGAGRLSVPGYFSGQKRLIKGRFSASGADDVAVIGASTGLEIVARRSGYDESRGTGFETHRITTETNVAAMIPMRLNSDGLNDLVMVGNGSVAPKVAMSDGTTVLIVNSTDDQTFGDCLGGSEPCGLRRAIQQANFFGGNAREIRFNIPGSGPFRFEPTSPYPSLLRETTIDGTTQPGFTGTPIIEIDGSNISGAAEGIRVQRPNCVIRGLVINNMPAVDFNGSLIGGSGIVVLSTNIRPNIQNTTIEGNYLGTNVDGTQRRPNWGNGIQIYDAYLNTVGGTVPQARNLLSGNGDNPQSGAPGVGIAITAGHENQIKGNYIGTDAAGNVKVRNSYGMFFAGIANEFGGNETGAGNVVSGNGGEPDQSGRCGGAGMQITTLFSLATGELVSYDNVVRGNLIGTNASGMAGLGNCYAGLTSEGNINTVVGSMADSGRNVISGNGYDGLACGFGSSFFELISGYCFIGGNNIGTNKAGSSAIPNTQVNNPGGFQIVTDTVYLPINENNFVTVGAPGGVTPDGPCTGFCNLISGNYGPWLGGGSIRGGGRGSLFILNNSIGTNRNGTAALPNFAGPNAFFGSFMIGGPLYDGENFIDGGNLISGNHANGLYGEVTLGGTFSFIRGNRIGLTSDGLGPLPNGVGGTESSGLGARANPTTTIIVGGTSPFTRNFVAAQTSDAISLGTRGQGINVSTGTGGRAEVAGNWVGLNIQGQPVGNSGDGIRAGGNGDTRIGGPGVGEGNVIKNNGRAGVAIISFAGLGQGNVNPERIQIRGNTIAFNGGLGIDLMNAAVGNNYPSGVTPNDCSDEDTGANNLQNFPELFTPVQNGDGTLRIDTILRSQPSRSFTIDYYLNSQADPTTYGEGESYLGSLNVFTNANGFVSAAFNTPIQLAPTAIITATATDENGNTSEFSCVAGVCHQTPEFAESIERSNLGLQCIEPIVVNVEGNEADLDGDLPIQQRDGLCDVDPNTPGEQCTLRAAIQEANARPGFDQINFDIPGGGIRTITIPNAGPILPDIKGDVDINALSQPGWSGTPMVQLVGEVVNQTAPVRGFTIAGSSVTIRGFAISRFANNILINNPSGNANGNRIENCYIGLNADGTFDPNTPSVIGVSILGNPTQAYNNKIGSVFNGNVIGNNSSGVVIAGTNARFNEVLGNKIGTNQAGTSAIPNEIGVVVGSGARENTVGAELNNGGNVISGNVGNGVAISSNATLNKVTGNFIGTAANGLDRLANGIQGVLITGGANNNTIGGPNDFRNIISGNNGSELPETASEILIDVNSPGNKVTGNFIGLKINWNEDFGVPFGVTVASSNNIIGGDPNNQNDFGARSSGVIVTATDVNFANNNKITYNRIGTVAVGQQPGNSLVGVTLQGNVKFTEIANNQISGNSAAGILIRDGASSTNIKNNKIGTDNGGFGRIANGVGIFLTSTSNNEIQSNLISGNNFANVFLGEDLTNQLPDVRAAMRNIDSYFPTVRRSDGSQTTTNNSIKKNFIGTNVNGTGAIQNGGIGVQIGEFANENYIGGDRVAGEGNTISGHNTGNLNFGIYIGSIFETPDPGRLPQNNLIQGNTIGLGVNGNFIGNGVGIKMTGGSNNIIGAEPFCVPKNDCEPSRYANVIGGNTSDGISIESENSSQTQVRANVIGVRDGGQNAQNGGNGIELSSVGETEVYGNTIGNNGENGLFVEDPQNVMRRRTDNLGFNVKISGNIVGIVKNAVGQNPILAGNQQAGILINNVPSVLIGSFATEEAKNIIAGNLFSGVKIVGANAQGNIINHSYIGTDDEATLNIGNGHNGVEIQSAHQNTIGDPIGDPDRAPTIGGNQRNGIALVNGSVFNTVRGSLVGVNRLFSSTLAVPNGLNGIRIDNSSNNRIGDALAPIRNFIGANQRSGVLVNGPFAQLNQIFNNQIGGSGLGNQQHGVHITGGANNTSIGGDQPNQGNEIFNNGGNGVLIDENEEGKRRAAGLPLPVNNRILLNNISGNGSIGIDIGEPGRTDNDPGDADEGINRGQNFPELENLHIDQFNRVLVDARVDSDPANQNYGKDGIRIDFYKSDLLGQGSLFLTSEYWTEDDYRRDFFVQYDLGNATEIGITTADRITAIATDADGNSSEFFPVIFTPTSAGVEVSGRVTTANGRPIELARLTLTDDTGNSRVVTTSRFGYFKFTDVEAGRTYILKIEHRGHSFSNPSRLLAVLDTISDIEFVAIE